MARKPNVEVECSHCGKPKTVWSSTYTASMNSNGLFFCDIKCCGKYRTGPNNPFYGKQHSEKTKAGMMARKPKRPRRMKQCECGCGSYAKPGNRFIYGHNSKGKINPMYGVEPWNKGKPLPGWVSDIISRGNKKAFEDPEIHAKYCGENNTFWRGGIAATPYGPGFSRPLKRAVKKRDCYCCRICGEREAGNIKHHVHHINYDKGDHKKENLMLLCNACHSKTNFNRAQWESYLGVLVEAPIGYDFMRAFEDNVRIVNELSI